MGENIISLRIGNRLPEEFTESQLEKLVWIAEEWLEFCQKHRKTTDGHCDGCFFNGNDLDLCGKFQEFFRMRKEKLNQDRQKLEATVSKMKSDLEKIANLKDFLDGKREAP